MINRSSSPSGKYAVIYQSLYLANLLLLPGIFFFVLVYYFRQYQLNNVENENYSQKNFDAKIRNRNLGIAKIHLIRSIQLSVIAGILLAVVPLAVIYFTEQLQASIMVGLIYFVTLHAGFVLLGMFNLSRAMANKLPIF
jgi:hypothetical protein